MGEEGGTTRWQILSAGGWDDMPDDVDQLLKKAQSARETEVEYTIAKHSYKADLKNLLQINTYFGTERRIREPVRKHVASAGSRETIWQVLLEDGTWLKYNDDAQRIIRKARDAGDNKSYVLPPNWKHKVDFVKMVQRNVS